MKKLAFLMPIALLALVGCAKGGNKGNSQPASQNSQTSTPSTPSTPSEPSEPESVESVESVESQPESQPAANVVECYLKKNGEDVSWWTSAEAKIYAYAWDGEDDPATEGVDETTNHRWFEATFVEAYDEGKTLYYEVQPGTQVPDHILFVRCNPELVATLPTEWPSAEGAVWNQTEDGTVAQKMEGEEPDQTPVAGRYWVDLAIK